MIVQVTVLDVFSQVMVLDNLLFISLDVQGYDYSSDGILCVFSSDGTWQVVYPVMVFGMLLKLWCLMCFLK